MGYGLDSWTVGYRGSYRQAMNPTSANKGKKITGENRMKSKKKHAEHSQSLV